METLPIEIITHIMRFLPLEDCNSCSFVSEKGYSASQDPTISSRLVCCLDLYDEAKKGIEVANYSRKRRITHLAIYDNCLSVWSGKETMFWMDNHNKFEMITTLHLANMAAKELLLNMIMHIATIFTNVQILELFSTVLFEALDDIEKREKVLGALGKIPQLYVLVEDRNFCNLPRLLNLKLNVRLLSIENKFVVIFKDLKNETCIMIRRGRNYVTGKKLLLNSQSEVCSLLGCALHFDYVDIHLPQLELSEILEEMSSFLELKIKYLNVKHYLPFTLEDKSSCLHQISKISLNHLVLHSTCYVHNWLSKEFLLLAALKCTSLKMIKCSERFDKITLGKIFSYCPFTESVHVSYIYNQESLVTNCTAVTVKYRTTPNGHLKALSLLTTFRSDLEITFVDFLSVLPSHLQTFSLTVESKINDPTIFSKLNDRCPSIRKLTIIFKTKGIQHSFVGEMGKLEELELLNCENNVVENMSFPCLNKLKIWFETMVSRDTFLAIAHSFRRIKCLNLRYWVQGCLNDGLKEGLAVLTDLEELKLQLVGNVNRSIFETLLFPAPSLTSLALERRDDCDFNTRVREYQNMHPNVKVTLLSMLGNFE